MSDTYNFGAELDVQLLTVQPWCTCPDPYWCDGSELIENKSAHTMGDNQKKEE